MGCCGDLRTTMALEGFDAPAALAVPGGTADVQVASLGGNAFKVRGTYTGRVYGFSPHARVQSVDAADSRVLLRTRHFRRA